MFNKLKTILKEKKRKKKINKIISELEEMDANAVLLGTVEDRHLYADAIIGISIKDPVAVMYDSHKVIESFMEMNNWDYEEALEWYEFNTVRAIDYMGEHKPILVDYDYD